MNRQNFVLLKHQLWVKMTELVLGGWWGGIYGGARARSMTVTRGLQLCWACVCVRACVWPAAVVLSSGSLSVLSTPQLTSCFLIPESSSWARAHPNTDTHRHTHTHYESAEGGNSARCLRTSVCVCTCSLLNTHSQRVCSALLWYFLKLRRRRNFWPLVECCARSSGVLPCSEPGSDAVKADTLNTEPRRLNWSSLGLELLHVRKKEFLSPEFALTHTEEEAGGEGFSSSSPEPQSRSWRSVKRLQDVGLCLQFPAYRGYRVLVRRRVGERLHQHPGVSSLHTHTRTHTEWSDLVHLLKYSTATCFSFLLLVICTPLRLRRKCTFYSVTFLWQL